MVRSMGSQRVRHDLATEQQQLWRFPCVVWKGFPAFPAHLRITPASFLEEDTADFPDELDTSFFARVSRRFLLCVSCSDGLHWEYIDVSLCNRNIVRKTIKSLL